MKYKIKILLLFILSGFLVLWASEEFFRRIIGGLSGSYPFAQTWIIKASEKEIVEAINELNKINPNFQPPNLIKLIEPRDRSTQSDHWLHFNLYYTDSKEIVHAWTRPNQDTTVTTFAFVSLSKTDDPEYLKLINRDFWYFANKRQIQKFKSTFIDRIQMQIETKRNP